MRSNYPEKTKVHRVSQKSCFDWRSRNERDEKGWGANTTLIYKNITLDLDQTRIPYTWDAMYRAP